MRKILKALSMLCVAFAALSAAVLAYSVPVSVTEGVFANVYGGAAYVLSFTASNSGNDIAYVQLFDENGAVLGEAGVGVGASGVNAYSEPIVMPQAKSSSGKVKVKVQGNGLTLSDIKLTAASNDILYQAQDMDGMLKISGNLDSANAGNITLYILTDAEEYEYQDANSVLFSQTMSVAKNGSFENIIDTSSLTGFKTNMTAAIYGLKSLGYGADAVAIDFTYENVGLRKGLLENLKNAIDSDKIQEVLEGTDGVTTYKEILGLSNVAVLDDITNSDKLYDYLFANKNLITDEAALKNLTITGCLIAALNGGIADDAKIADYINTHCSELGLNDEKFTPYTKTYKNETAEIRTAVVTAMKKGNIITTAEDFKKVFANEALLTVLNSKSNYSETISVLAENAQYLGINNLSSLSDGQKNILAQYIAGITDVTLIKSKINELLQTQSGKPNGSSSGGSSGGGGGGGLPIVSYPKTSEKKEDVLESGGIKMGFNDISKKDWAYEYIVKLAENKIIDGYEDGSFRPVGEISRAEFSKLAAVAFGIPLENYESVFLDVAENDWSAPYILALYKNGIVNGIGNGIFGKNAKISRQDMAVMLYRIAKLRNIQISSGDIAFADGTRISDYAKEAVAAMSKMGVFNGDQNNCFNPAQNATRAEVCKVICVMLELLK